MVITMTCQLTLTVECVAARMYQLTPAKFMPLPKSDTNIATKKYRNPRCAQIRFQSTRCAVVVAIKLFSLLLWRKSVRTRVRKGYTLPTIWPGMVDFNGERSNLQSAVWQAGVGREGATGDERGSFSRRFSVEDSFFQHQIGKGCGWRTPLADGGRARVVSSRPGHGGKM